jgi:hypothetical protein
MPIRTFQDDRGRKWWVWPVEPTHVERRVMDPPENDPPVIERRQRREIRIQIGEQWVNGWLAFETKGERRRLAEFPPDWDRYSEQALVHLCNQAAVVTNRPRDGD